MRAGRIRRAERTVCSLGPEGRREGIDRAGLEECYGNEDSQAAIEAILKKRSAYCRLCANPENTVIRTQADRKIRQG